MIDSRLIIRIDRLAEYLRDFFLICLFLRGTLPAWEPCNIDDIVRSMEYIVCTTAHKLYYWLLGSRLARCSAEYIPGEESHDRQWSTSSTKDEKNDREKRTQEPVSTRSYSPHRSKSLNESPLLRMLCFSVSFTFPSLFPVLSVLYAVVIDTFN